MHTTALRVCTSVPFIVGVIALGDIRIAPALNLCRECLPQRLGNCANNMPPNRSTSDSLVMVATATVVSSVAPLASFPTTVIYGMTMSTLADVDTASSLGAPSQQPLIPSIGQLSLPAPPAQYLTNFRWGPLEGAEFSNLINIVYDEVIHYR